MGQDIPAPTLKVDSFSSHMLLVFSTNVFILTEVFSKSFRGQEKRSNEGNKKGANFFDKGKKVHKKVK